MSTRSIELLHIDCMEYMAAQPDKSFDLAIVDPPYGIDCFKKPIGSPGRMFSGDKRVHEKGVVWDIRPGEDYFKEIKRVSKHQIIWGGNYMLDYLGPTRGFIFWDKHQTVPNFSDGELAWTSFDRPAKCFRFMYTNVVGRDATHFHPTQKPIKLYEWLLTNYAKPGQRILDTHLGSGSSAIAAHYFGCDFVGCELDEYYFKAAKARFEKETRQLSMFDWEPQCAAQ